MEATTQPTSSYLNDYLIPAASDILSRCQKLIKIPENPYVTGSNHFSSEALHFDKEQFDSHISKLEAIIAEFKKIFLESEVELIGNAPGLPIQIMAILPFVFWSLDDKSVIDKFNEFGVKKEYLRRHIDINRIILELRKLEKTNGISLLMCPLFESIHIYCYARFTNDILLSTGNNHKLYDKIKNQSTLKIYLRNLIKRIEIGNGNLKKLIEPILDIHYLEIYKKLQTKIPDKKILRQTLLKLADGSMELEILGFQILKYINFDEKKIKGDTKYVLLFDLYEAVFHHGIDFYFYSEQEYNNRELNSYKNYNAPYVNYDDFKRHFIKTTIFKKFKSPISNLSST